MVGRVKGGAARRRGIALGAVLGLVAALLAVTPADARVPRATGDNAVITVKVGGDRQDDGQIAGRQGVSLQLLAYDGDSTPGPPVNTSWSTCTSDSRGDCSFVVPDTQASQSGTPAGANRNTRFWVTQVSAPAGWLTNPTLRTGTATSAATQVVRRNLAAVTRQSRPAERVWARCRPHPGPVGLRRRPDRRSSGQGPRVTA